MKGLTLLLAGSELLPQSYGDGLHWAVGSSIQFPGWLHFCGQLSLLGDAQRGLGRRDLEVTEGGCELPPG